MKCLLVYLFTVVMITSVTHMEAQTVAMKKNDFVYLDDYLSNAIYEIRYGSDDNFLGRPVKGYQTKRLVLTRQAAVALQAVEEDLASRGYLLKIFDTYRPQTAVNDFISWSKIPYDTITRSQYYPEHDKSLLFRLGYISSRSGHSRGSTIDLTICHAYTGHEVDMGGPYDYFGELSHHDYDCLTPHQKANREILRQTMSKHGFRDYSKEWWHYTLRGEPYPNTFFDFIVE